MLLSNALDSTLMVKSRDTDTLLTPTAPRHTTQPLHNLRRARTILLRNKSLSNDQLVQRVLGLIAGGDEQTFVVKILHPAAKVAGNGNRVQHIPVLEHGENVASMAGGGAESASSSRIVVKVESWCQKESSR